MNVPSRLGLVALCLVIPGVSLGQAGTPEPAVPLTPEQLSQVIITGSRLPASRWDFGRAQTLSRSDLEAAAPFGAGDLLLRSAGVMVDRRGRKGGYGSLYLRGADPSHVVILVDGVRQNDPLSSRGSAVDLNSLNVGDVDRVEIVRTNASSVHGEALAGVIQFFTRRERESKALATAEAGGDGLRAIQASYAAESIGLSASHREDGASRGAGVRNGSANLSYRFGTAVDTIDLAVRRSHGESRGYPDESGGERFAVERRLEEVRTETGQAALSWRRTLSADLEVDARFARFDRWGSQDTPAVAPGARDPFGLPATMTHTDYTRGELQLGVTGSHSAWDWSVGAQVQRERGDFKSTLLLGQPVPAAFSLERTTRAIYSEVRRATNDWSVQAGARAERARDGAFRLHPSAALTYGWTAHSQIGMTLSSASKAPSFYALGHPLVGNPDLAPETTRQAEVHYASEDRAGLSTKVTLFAARFHNLVDFDPGPPPRLVNRTIVRSRGVELDARQQLNQQWSTRLQATFMSISKADGAVPLRYRPQYQLTAGAQAVLYEAWRAEARVLRVARRFDSSIPTGDQWLGGFTEVSATLRRSFTHAEIAFSVDNLTNHRAEEVVGTPSGGRRISLSMRVWN